MDTEVNPEHPASGASVPKRPAPRLPGREPELGRLTGLFPVVLGGAAASAVVAGEFGMGKSATLRTAAALAADAGFTVAMATGSRLESHLAGGLVRQLADALDEPGASPRPPAAELCGSAGESEALDLFFRIVRDATERGPLFLGIDNIHLADAWSMRCLAYLRNRVLDLPVLIVLTSVIGYPPHREVALLDMVGSTPVTITLNGLGDAAAAEILGLAPGDLASACREATGGNPVLLQALRPRLLPGADPHELGSSLIGQVLTTRVQEFPHAPAILHAAAILGEDAGFDLLARLAGVDELDALQAIDTLVRLHVLNNSDQPTLTYSFVRNSLLKDMPQTTRAVNHSRAAKLLTEAGAPPDRVAAHLLEATSIRIPWAVDVLRLSARDAVFSGRPELAARHLRRALEERLTSGRRMAVLLQLAHAEFQFDPPGAAKRVREAVDTVGNREKAAYIATAMLLSLCGGQDARLGISAAGQIAARLDAGGPDAVWPLLCMTYLAEAGSRLGPPPEFRDFEEQWAPLTDPAAQRSRSALLALDAVRSGESAQDAVGHFADALSQAGASDTREPNGDDGELFEQHYFFTLATAVLADEPAHVDRLCRVLDVEREPWDVHVPHGALPTLARGIALQTSGDLQRASVHFESLLRRFDERGGTTTCPVGVLCAARLVECWVDLGRFEAATSLLDRMDFVASQGLFTHTYLLYARGRLRVATGYTRFGFEDLLSCGRRLAHHGMRFPGFVPWRAHAARAALALGQTDDAARLAEEDINASARWGAARPLGTALTTLGLVREDDEAERALQKAITTLRTSPSRLQLATALTELGTLQSRHGQSEKAIETLRQAVELSEQCGARPLARRAAEELRSSRRALTPAKDNEHGLTRQENRIAVMAAQGLTNREIATALHLTRRTVELHLSGAYRKLGIPGRAELGGALAKSSQRVDGR
ncbi:LuxR family transcriptional regulator fused with ATPase domain [Amycolatopsis mediterranei S699]|uniref:LuxR family transcriptional regulator fused with ATPase domain n=2 Tax=Amycolatopsis mediterranei TaxID=33910 RepID=A0A0H3CWG6_AMYMU|nr:LuxR family transcriptional regulator [Amycolatopsis mediterranei]ADJ42992.1 LuxR family transcriptional regulator fused with ATPase domain [Amycolatopsis mediterranei U32]AEK39687.1 LuxR family transcriptional regulator fused with ATPase domain [Amycolatopsis mediterranei S699]AFO74706.1 LuxR family transcriptional regulator fused with ATPase domain [Amycolatopsis mediterranei S699]AGT81835.1 LuxR family transcriptional regulator fused with ATPase domain [Amycolatopsis mediterranei RB]KDO0